MPEIWELYQRVERYRSSTIWQRLFPSNQVDSFAVKKRGQDASKKKTNALRYLFSASSKFVKSLYRGIYLTSITYTEGKILCTVDDCLPIICVEEGCVSVGAEDMNWLAKMSLCWSQVPYFRVCPTSYI